MAWVSVLLPDTPIGFMIIVLGLCLVLLSYQRNRVPAQCNKLPPGPWGLPVIGAAFRLGKDIYKDFLKMSEEYGDMFSLYIGSRLVVVLNGSDVINEALVKNSTAFAGRPDLHTMCIAGSGGRGILNADYGKKWQVMRKASISAIHKYLVTKDVLHSILHKNRDYLIDQLQANQGRPCDVMPMLKSTTAGVILGILFGDRYDKQDVDKVLEFSDDFRETVGCGMAVDFMPWLKHFSDPKLDRLIELLDTAKEMIGRLYYENRLTHTKGKIRNLADSLLENIENLKAERLEETTLDSNSNVDFQDLPTDHRDSIVTLVDLFGAGFDTSSITLYFAIAYLVAYPEVQKKIQDELDGVVGRDRKPEVEDLKELHYTNAFMYELHRICCLAPSAVPHSTTTDVTLRGYFIPKGTVVFANLWSVSRDPTLWEDPNVFKPDRFLDDKGQVVHPKGLQKYLPFGAGRRVCVGKALAEVEIPFLVTNLVHHFEFTSKEMEGNKEIEVENGLTLKPVNFSVTLKER